MDLLLCRAGNFGGVPVSQWRRDYNEQRPHSALNDQTPLEFAAEYRGLARWPC
ncbi:hypothetical protein CF392_10645 [Tamilnaduibacter salinus]|uniref:Integrase catalytic domain-containing protein n=1 Tax=Tamilnaduibacter salinus TaxID=1484056 RepID=A0A2A2I2G6_9GAMM|nr:hypothetical protein CF392_10645 [Tamilnaduibacter salinus]